jgi:hypothetical protein
VGLDARYHTEKGDQCIPPELRQVTTEQSRYQASSWAVEALVTLRVLWFCALSKAKARHHELCWSGVVDLQSLTQAWA